MNENKTILNTILYVSIIIVSGIIIFLLLVRPAIAEESDIKRESSYNCPIGENKCIVNIGAAPENLTIPLNITAFPNDTVTMIYDSLLNGVSSATADANGSLVVNINIEIPKDISDQRIKRYVNFTSSHGATLNYLFDLNISVGKPSAIENISIANCKPVNVGGGKISIECDFYTLPTGEIINRTILDLDPEVKAFLNNLTQQLNSFSQQGENTYYNLYNEKSTDYKILRTNYTDLQRSSTPKLWFWGLLTFLIFILIIDILWAFREPLKRKIGGGI